MGTWRNGLAIAAALLSGVVSASMAAESWQLPKVEGKNSANGPVWQEGWTHQQGNPLTVNGATWTAVYTEAQSPELQGPYLPMKPGSYCNFNLIWQNGEEKIADPAHQLRGMMLTSRSGKEPQHGPLSAIIFTPPAAGSYTLALAGKMTLQNPTAGYARLVVFKLSQQRQKVEVLKTFNLNKAVAGAFGGYPADFKYDGPVELKDGEELAVSVQSVNPGPAPAGTAAVTFQAFSLTK